MTNNLQSLISTVILSFIFSETFFYRRTKLFNDVKISCTSDNSVSTKFTKRVIILRFFHFGELRIES